MISGSQAASMFDQLAIVEETMRTRGWNPRIAEELAQQLGVTRRTVYNIRNRAIQWTKRQLRTEDIEARRAEQYQLADEAARKALSDGDYAGVASLLKVAASLTGTIAPTKVEVGGTVSHVHSAAVERVASLAPEQLEERRRLALEASFSEVAPDAEVVPVPAESD